MRSPITFSAIPGLAPRRHRLTQTFGGGAKLILDFDHYFEAPRTFLAAVPIESACYAARLGLVNPYNIQMAVESATIYPSDTPAIAGGENLCALMDNGPDDYPVVPTRDGVANIGGRHQVFFDHAGADASVLTITGQSKSALLQPNPDNPGNAIRPFTIYWSDWIPVTSLPRADGGVQPYLFIYVTVRSKHATFGTSRPFNRFNLDESANRGRRHYFGMAKRVREDFAGNPAGTTWKTLPEDPRNFKFNPLYALQYLTASPGIQIAAEGDSLSAGPQEDEFSSSLWRAAADISTPSLPVAYASFAYGGQNSGVYSASMRRNFSAILPSVMAYQPISRNDPGELAAGRLQALLAAALLHASGAGADAGCRMLLNIPGLIPAASANPIQSAGFADMRDRLLALSRDCGIPVIDAAAAFGDIDGQQPWRYLPGYSNDDSHPNTAAAEALVPQAVAALRSLIG